MKTPGGVHGKQDHGQIGDDAEQGFAGAQGNSLAPALGHVPQQDRHGWLAMMQQRDSHYFRFYFAPVEPLERSLSPIARRRSSVTRRSSFSISGAAIRCRRNPAPVCP